MSSGVVDFGLRGRRPVVVGQLGVVLVARSARGADVVGSEVRRIEHRDVAVTERVTEVAERRGCAGAR